MLRFVSTALREIAVKATNTNVRTSIVSKCNPIFNSIQYRNFGVLSTIVQKWITVGSTRHNTLLNYTAIENHPALTAKSINIPVRTVTKFSKSRGKRATVKTVLKRFYRLSWGIWIRPKAGRNKHLWVKSTARKKRLREHVFCNATQSTLLDKMVSPYWKRRHFYIDDPYEPYHEREEFFITRRKPMP